jgi:hypothetical protein
VDGNGPHNADDDLAEGYRLLAGLKAQRQAAGPDDAAAVHMLWPIPASAHAAVVKRLLQYANHPHDLEALEAQRQQALERAQAAKPTTTTTTQSGAPPEPADRGRRRDEPPRPRPLSYTITLRHSLRAMGLLAELGELNLLQQKRDRQAKVDSATSFKLSVATRANGVKRDRREAAARRRAEAAAAGLPEPPPEPEPVQPPAPAPEPRQDWPIPEAARAPLIERLTDIIDPEGRLGRVAAPDDVMLAIRTLNAFSRLDAAQRRLDAKFGAVKVKDINAIAQKTVEKTILYLEEKKRREQVSSPDVPKEPRPM